MLLRDRTSHLRPLTLSTSVSGCHDLLSVVPEALRFIEKARKADGRVLIYCSTGCSRAAALVLAYMMASSRYSYATAVQELQSRRPDARPHGSFMQQLLDFQTILTKTRGASQSTALAAAANAESRV